MITRKEGIMVWANRWRMLRAWRRDLSLVKIDISDRAYANRLGTCWPHEQRLTVYRGASMIDELGTLIHELAHAATIDANHDDTWQGVYSAAVTEITCIAVIPVAYNYEILNAAAKDAMRAWWRASGNATIWAMASKKVSV